MLASVVVVILSVTFLVYSLGNFIDHTKNSGGLKQIVGEIWEGKK